MRQVLRSAWPRHGQLRRLKMGLERLFCGYDAATVFLAFGYCLTSRHAAQTAGLPARFADNSRRRDARLGLRRSLLSIINKFAVLHFPYPAALTGFQYAVSAVSVIVLCVAAFRAAAPQPRARRRPRAPHPHTTYQPLWRQRGGGARSSGGVSAR